MKTKCEPPIVTRKNISKLSMDDIVKRAISSEDNDELMIIAKSSCDYAKVFAARNIHSKWDTLEVLARSDSRSVREAALANPCTLPTTIKIAESKDRQFKSAI